MKSSKQTLRSANRRLAGSIAMLLAGAYVASPAQAIPTQANIAGEIERITLDNPADHWTGGKVVVAGQTVILPKNLLIDLPANRLTLWQLVDQAPEPCKSRGETGLAKGDTCNVAGMGAIVTLSANRTSAGNVIAGDVLIEKGQEAVTGKVTFINFNDGYLRIDGEPDVDAGGILARMNDPTSRHSIQQGLGCTPGALDNCSPDPRFGLDPDNYVQTATTGYPMCIPSTMARSWAGLPQQGASNTFNFSAAVAGGTAQAGADGTGDALCPESNRPVNDVVADSRRFAPIKVGDNIEMEGNWEVVDDPINGRVRFLSFHTSLTHVALGTRADLTQPDYFLPSEVFVEGPSFQNLRARSLLIGFSTRPPDILWWTLHYDPVTGTHHEKPFASTAGCDAVTALGTCSAAGILGAPNLGAAGGNIFRIRYDVDFVIGAKADLDPCAQVNAEPRFGLARKVCPNWVTTGKPALYNEAAIGDMFALLSPIPHELQARTGHALAATKAGIVQQAVDVNGKEATFGQYLYPLGINLGGIELAEMTEINVNNLQMAHPFSGIPWNLDRRLSPNGCLRQLQGTGTNAVEVPVCEGTPQPLIPFPFEGYDPREQTNGCAALAGSACELPKTAYTDAVYTAAPLSNVRNRVLSYMTRIGSSTPAVYDFAGNASVLAWPPVDPVGTPIAVTPAVDYCISEAGNCLPPPATPTCGDGTVLANGACIVPQPTCAPGQVIENNACVNPTLACATGQTAVDGFCVFQVPTCTATQVLQNNVCVNVTPVCATGLTAQGTACVDTLTASSITWVATGGARGLRVVLKASAPSGPVPTIQVSATSGPTTVLPATTLTPVAVNQGAISCTGASPCWVFSRPPQRTVADVKPTSIVFRSSKGGVLTVTSGF